jgi:NodT family efflux transporter outer membrane factor (OMF) lipoprotein
MALCGLMLLAGCSAVGPDYVAPETPVPAQWHNATTDAAADRQEPEEAALARWWRNLQDPELTRLILLAVADNIDVREAVSRIRQARYQHRISRAAFFPTVDASGTARKSGQADDTGTITETELYSAGFDAVWELDLFGGTRRAAEAARADIEAGIEDLNDVMVTLTAEVATNYIALRTYQARLSVARRNVASQEETWQLLDTLSRTGMGDELAVSQARYNLESSRSKIPDLKVGVEESMNRLAVLTGQPAGTLHAQLAEARPLPAVSLELAVGVPADTLRQRPDVRRAERELAAQTARIGEAQADLYPKLTLNGSIGLESLSTGDLFSSASRVWSLGPSISWPIFRAGAIRNNIKVQEELQAQALARYEAAVLSALEEVENALTAYAQEQEKIEMLLAAAESARSAAELAGHQYTTGMIGFGDVLDAQRSLLSFEDQMAESRGAVLTDLVRLYKSLGGGWQSFGPAADPQSEDVNKG